MPEKSYDDTPMENYDAVPKAALVEEFARL